MLQPLWYGGLISVITLLQGMEAAYTKRPISLEVEEGGLVPLLQTDSVEYSLAVTTADPVAAQEICHKNNAKLLSIQTGAEFQLLIKKLEDYSKTGTSLGDFIWTSGISFKNATVDELLLWNSTMEKIDLREFFPFKDDTDTLDRGKRNNDGDDCPCPCTPSPLPPFTRPPCKKPKCTVDISSKPCVEVGQRQCSITRPPNCQVTPHNCTVNCNEPCRIKQQPICTVKTPNPNNPRCRLKPRGPCSVSKPQCRVVSPGVCTAVQDQCKQDDSACKPVIRPCKNPCTQQECTTVEMPCHTTQEPCKTVMSPGCAAPPTPPCTIEKKCWQKREGKGKSVCEMVKVCPSPPPLPDHCKPIVTCPPPQVTCPPPVSACTKPFVDCSPEICQSNVQICLPPKINCPPPRIICEDPKVECTDTVEECPEPEVECGQAEVTCTKPVVECPDAVVHCDPMMTTCDHAPVTCSPPNMECIQPVITCGEPEICPGPTESYTNCKCDGGSCQGSNKRDKRDSLAPIDTLCLAMKKELGFKWVPQSCNLKYKFICEKNSS